MTYETKLGSIFLVQSGKILVPYFIEQFQLPVLHFLQHRYIHIYQRLSDRPPIHDKIYKSLLLLNENSLLLVLVGNRPRSKVLFL
jgi:hypothetical protein